jgi:PAS domain S-box-containing protein
MNHSPGKEAQSNPEDRQNQMAQVFRNFQQCIQHCDKAVFFTDPAGILQRVNPAFEKLTGFVSTESVGKDLSWMVAEGPTSGTYRRIWQKIFENRVFRGTLEVRRRDGDSFKMDLTAISVRDTKGRITSLVCTGQDRREAEAIEAELSRARKSYAGSTHARALAHDLNNTLMLISGCAELALDGVSAGHALRHRLEEIKNAAHRACELGQGMLACTTAENGAEFPSVESAAEPEPAPAALIAQAKPWPAETLLVVEDESVVRTAAVEFLSGGGYQVISACNGQEALEKVHAHPGKIHLVITDLVMPDMSGTKLAEMLASIRPESKVLFVSGHSEDEVLKQGVPDPANNFLQKPFSFQALGNKVRNLLGEQVRARAYGAGAD